MGCASSSTAKPNSPSRFCFKHEGKQTYDLFLCCAGETRGGFTSHLIRELKLAGVRVFTDELLPRGEAISSVLFDRIKESRSTMIVVSGEFAASHWCLDEVAESFKCKKEKLMGHHIFPIFYKVDPSELRHLRGRTTHHLALHEERYGKNSDKVAWWRACLVLLSDIAGWHITTGGNESDLIQTIVKEVVTALRTKNTASNVFSSL